MLPSRGALLFFKVIREILKSHSKKKNIDFDPNWALMDCNSSLNSPMAMEWWKRLEVAWERGHLFVKVICQISRSHSSKIITFDQNWVFPYYNSSLNSLMAMETAKLGFDLCDLNL